jgi:DnaJ-domain-containing protein 1
MPTAASILEALLATQERHRALRLRAFREDGEITARQQEAIMTLTSGLFDDATLRFHLERMVAERLQARGVPFGHSTIVV